jgi:hypothetical protein
MLDAEEHVTHTIFINFIPEAMILLHDTNCLGMKKSLKQVRKAFFSECFECRDGHGAELVNGGGKKSVISQGERVRDEFEADDGRAWRELPHCMFASTISSPFFAE